jgi:hypothetical protein
MDSGDQFCSIQILSHSRLQTRLNQAQAVTPLAHIYEVPSSSVNWGTNYLYLGRLWFSLGPPENAGIVS